MRFAHLKTHHRFERMRLRGLSGTRDEFHLAAIAQNLKTLANHICGRRLMPRSLALRECRLPQKPINSVNGKPLEGARPINEAGGSRLKLK